MSLAQILLPEIILTIAACVLFLLGLARGNLGGRTAALLACAALVASLGAANWQQEQLGLVSGQGGVIADAHNQFRLSQFSSYVRMIALAIGVLLLLLQSPNNKNGTGNDSLDYSSSRTGSDAGEFMGLSLLALLGLILVASSNDLISLFLGIELASIPTYILVASGRPLAVAQEASLKYFFLGAMSAAILLLGLAYLYGTTGTMKLIGPAVDTWQQLDRSTGLMTEAKRPGSIAAVITEQIQNGQTGLTPWQLLAAVLLIVGLMFKLAAFPMHAYAGDVYEGASTPVTALLGFVPKATGIIALIKLLHVFSGGAEIWNVPAPLDRLIWVLAVITMTVGNVLALRQVSVKRTLAYSSVAHSGYLLAGLATLAMLGSMDGGGALKAVLFYLPIYGVMSTAAFAVLMYLPARASMRVGGKDIVPPATTAETFEDIAGTGRERPLLGLAMALACLSLMGVPITAGFWAKFYLLVPAFTRVDSQINPWLLALGVIVLINSAIGAVYYLRIIAEMFSRPREESEIPTEWPKGSFALTLVIAVTVSIMLLGFVGNATEGLADSASSAASGLDTQSIPIIEMPTEEPDESQVGASGSLEVVGRLTARELTD